MFLPSTHIDIDKPQRLEVRSEHHYMEASYERRPHSMLVHVCKIVSGLHYTFLKCVSYNMHII